MPVYRIEWVDAARSDVRRLDKTVAMQVFDAVLRFARENAGDVTPLHGALSGTFRLRVGDYRVLFSIAEDCMQIFGVRHRSEAYR